MSSILSFLAKTPAKLSLRPSLIKNNLIKSVNFSKLSTILDKVKETVFLCRQTYVFSLIDQRQQLSIDNSSRPISSRNRVVIDWWRGLVLIREKSLINVWSVKKALSVRYVALGRFEAWKGISKQKNLILRRKRVTVGAWVVFSVFLDHVKINKLIIIINVNTLLVSFYSLKMLLRLQLLKQNKEYFDESVLSDSDTWIKERKQKIRSKCFIYGQK